MNRRLTEKDLKVLEQKKIKMSPKNSKTTKTIITKIAIAGKAVKAKSSNHMKITDLIKENQTASFRVSVSDTHFSVAFEGAKLLSINQIFALLQSKKTKFQLFAYKKSWHNIIRDILLETHASLHKEGKKLPFFDDSVELTIFRQAPRLVDEDAVTTMFKYIIDAFKRDEHNQYGVLAEDNPKIVNRIEFFNEKGPHSLGIKIKLIEGTKKENYTLDQILIK